MKEYRNSLSDDIIKEKSIRISNNLINCRIINSDIILVLSFASYNNEPHTDIIHKAIREKYPHIRLAYPRVCNDRINMDYYYVEDYDKLKNGYMNIPEPPVGSELVHDNYIAVNEASIIMIVPGLAFDMSGGRTGYGGGFYDRFLEKHNKLTKVAICYDGQLLNDTIIEVDNHDIKMDYIITDKEVINV